MAQWLIVNNDMHYQQVVNGETMEEVAYYNDLRYATLIIRLDNETIETIKRLSEES